MEIEILHVATCFYKCQKYLKAYNKVGSAGYNT